jgi:MFS transporter, FHS family, glucose/mannose:H+ symporter
VRYQNDGAVEPKRGAPLSPSAIAGAFGASLMIGALTSFYGPLLPYLETRFGVPRTTAGAVLGADFGGSLAGVSWAIWGARGLAERSRLLIALAAVVVGMAGVVAASRWWFLLAGVALGGAGFGILDFSLNRLFAAAFDQGRGAMLNVLNALFGVGAVIGPLLVAVLARRHMSWLFAGTALVAIAIAPLIARIGTVPAAPGDRAPAAAGEPAAGRYRLSRRAWFFIAAYLLYLGVEGGVSGWAATHLKALGYSSAFADATTSAFWLCLTAGRFLIAPVTLRVSSRKIVLTGIGATAVVLLFALAKPAAPYAYALAGLTLGPVWPTGLAWLSESDADSGAAGYLIAASMLGGAVLPYSTGWIIQQTGVRATPAVVAGFAVATAAALTAAGQPQQARQPPPASGATGVSSSTEAPTQEKL